MSKLDSSWIAGENIKWAVTVENGSAALQNVKIELPYDLVVLSLVIYPRETNRCLYKKLYTNVLNSNIHNNKAK